MNRRYSLQQISEVRLQKVTLNVSGAYTRFHFVYNSPTERQSRKRLCARVTSSEHVGAFYTFCIDLGIRQSEYDVTRTVYIVVVIQKLKFGLL